jgi:CheY-like chemotaxis protein
MSTVLVVDDDADVCATIEGALRGIGLSVRNAGDGYEALRLLVEYPVDLMITDIRMPGLNGFQLARQARLIHPTLHVIYLSAYPGGADERAGPTFGPFMHKPFRAAQLAKEVERELSAH